jgi:broad specificity phosphatase PhoE
MQIYLVRHGQSLNNAGDTSSHNVPLTQPGHEQIRLAADALAAYRFQALYCSPLERALQSAAIIHSRSNLAPYVRPFFSEVGFSWGEPNATREQLQAAYPFAVLDPAITSNGWAPAVHETEEEAYERAGEVIRWLSERHPGPDARILVVSHGRFGAILMGYVVASRPCGYARFSQNNGAISRVDITDEVWKLRFLNSTAHLPDGLLT